MSQSDYEDLIAASIEQTKEIRKDIYVGVSPKSFAGAVAHAWEAAKRISREDGVGYPERLLVVDQWVTGTNPITWYCVLTMGWPPATG